MVNAIISKDGLEVLEINQNNKKKVIGSKYNNRVYLDSVIETLENSNIETTIIIFGLGSGMILNNYPLDNYKVRKIIFIEPSIEVYNYNIKFNGEILEKYQLEYITLSEFEKKLNYYIIEDDMLDLKFVDSFNCKNIFSDEYNRILKILYDISMSKIINFNTESVFESIHLENYINNLLRINKSIELKKLKNMFENMPAIIVSAGPSLSKNIDILSKNKDKFIIITGQRTLKTLLDKGIEPDIVCSVDPSILCYDMVKTLECDKYILVQTIVANYKLVSKFKDNIIFNEKNLEFFANKYLHDNIPKLFMGGSVAHACVAFADYIGCNPVVFVGQDFAYTNDKMHADIASYEKTNIEYKKFNYVDDIYGEKVKTDKILDYYRKNMEKYISTRIEKEYINATEGGANIQGTKIRTLINVSDKIEKLDKKYIKNKILNSKRIEFTMDILAKIKNDNERLKNSCLYFEKRLNNCNDNETVCILEQLNVFIEEIRENECLNLCIKSIEDKIISKQEYKITNKETELELINKMKNQMLELIKDIKETLIYIESVLNKIER